VWIDDERERGGEGGMEVWREMAVTL